MRGSWRRNARVSVAATERATYDAISTPAGRPGNSSRCVVRPDTDRLVHFRGVVRRSGRRERGHTVSSTKTGAAFFRCMGATSYGLIVVGWFARVCGDIPSAPAYTGIALESMCKTVSWCLHRCSGCLSTGIAFAHPYRRLGPSRCRMASRVARGNGRIDRISEPVRQRPKETPNATCDGSPDVPKRVGIRAFEPTSSIRRERVDRI